MRHEQLTISNLRDASIAVLASGSLFLAACGDSVEADSPETSTTTMLEETTITLPTTTVISPSTESTTTTITLPETTTTTTDPLPDWYNRIYEENGCDDGIVMPVIVQGEDGRNITAQVSWDFDSKMNGQKLDENGNPIEDRYSQYSDFVYINPELPPEGSFDQGTNQICIEDMPPNASVHVEVYKIEQKLDEPLIEYARYILSRGTENDRTAFAAGIETKLRITESQLSFQS